MSDEYAGKVMRVAVAKVCESLDIGTTHKSCFDMLFNLAINHITDVATRANENAELAGRTITNTTDVALALNDRGQNVDTLARFMENSDKLTIPDVPNFPQYSAIIKNNPISTSEFASLERITDGKGKTQFRLISSAPPSVGNVLSGTPASVTVDKIFVPPPASIPPYLPLFPFTHTYSQNPISSIPTGRTKGQKATNQVGAQSSKRKINAESSAALEDGMIKIIKSSKKIKTNPTLPNVT